MNEGMISILFEDMHLVAADKPAGIHTAPLARGETGTLLHYLIERYPEIALVRGFKPVEPGLLHRLDKETSGIVIAARTDSAFMKLKEQFDRGDAIKEYMAVCARDTENGADGIGACGNGSEFHIESRFVPFGPGGRKVRVVPLEGGGKALLKKATAGTYATEVRIERRSGAYLLVRARISKGFRHQVRAHLAHLGMPIVGDPLYGVPTPSAPKAHTTINPTRRTPEGRTPALGRGSTPALGRGLPTRVARLPSKGSTPALGRGSTPAVASPRMYLHATMVELRHPATGALLRVVSPMPEAFAGFFPA